VSYREIHFFNLQEGCWLLLAAGKVSCVTIKTHNPPSFRSFDQHRSFLEAPHSKCGSSRIEPPVVSRGSRPQACPASYCRFLLAFSPRGCCHEDPSTLLEKIEREMRGDSPRMASLESKSRLDLLRLGSFASSEGIVPDSWLAYKSIISARNKGQISFDTGHHRVEYCNRICLAYRAFLTGPTPSE